jgi:2-octaprenyl-6-methoxyphenol hydroxylase
MPAADADVVIHGAGPVGCALALALRPAGLRVALVAAASPAPAFRPLALSYASRLILERLGVWGAFAVTPIETILVTQAGGYGRTRLAAGDAGVPALGYVTEYSALLAALRKAVENALCETPPSAARCIVHAEGTPADVRGKRYAQDAVVGLVQTEPSSAAQAFERFTAEGPLALLPHAGRYALIWSARPERARRLAQASATQFLALLAAAAGRSVGRPVAVQSRAVQPLSLKVRATRVAGNEVYIGNAAQTLHPVAGQGLNLGLRDAWDLARMIVSSSDPASPALLARFAAGRRLDAAATIAVSDLLAAGFVGSSPLLRAARGAALTLLDVLPGPRRFFARRMIFGASALP